MPTVRPVAAPVVDSGLARKAVERLRELAAGGARVPLAGLSELGRLPREGLTALDVVEPGTGRPLVALWSNGNLVFADRNEATRALGDLQAARAGTLGILGTRNAEELRAAFRGAVQARSAVLLGKIKFGSEVFPQGWEKVPDQGFRVSGKDSAGRALTASKAVEAFYEDPRACQLDCAAFVQLVWYGAILDAFGKEFFDGPFARKMDGRWFGQPGTEEELATAVQYESTPPLDLVAHTAEILGVDRATAAKEVAKVYGPEAASDEVGTPSVPTVVETDQAKMRKAWEEAPVGARVTWVNRDPRASAAYTFENAIKIGPNEFAAHPLGVRTLEKMDATWTLGRVAYVDPVLLESLR